MFSGLRETKLLHPVAPQCKRYSASFCALDIGSAFEQGLTAGEQKEIPYLGDSKSIFAALEAAREHLARTNFQRSASAESDTSATSAGTSNNRNYPITSLPNRKNSFSFKNVNFVVVDPSLHSTASSPSNKLKENSTKSRQTSISYDQNTNRTLSVSSDSSHHVTTSSQSFSYAQNKKKISEFPPKNHHAKEDETGPFKCRFCPKLFPFHCHLQVHERVHTKEKPYSCDRCPRRFSQLGSLTVHHRIHTGEMPYFCVSCSKRFRHVNSLKRHQRQLHHHGKQKREFIAENSLSAENEMVSRKARRTSSVETSRLVGININPKSNTDCVEASSTVRSNEKKNVFLRQTTDDLARRTPQINSDARLQSSKVATRPNEIQYKAVPKLSNKRSSSIFTSIEKLLDLPKTADHESKTTTHTFSSVKKAKMSAEHFPVLRETKIEHSFPNFLIPHVARPHTFTTPTLSYETNSVLKRPSDRVSEHMDLHNNDGKIFNTTGISAKTPNWLLLTSLVFSPQFCKPALGSVLKSA